MSFAVNMQELRERASQRAASVATVATLLPDDGSKVAGVARVTQTVPQSETVPQPAGAGTQAAGPSQSVRIYRMTRAHGDEAHAVSWAAETIEAFTARRDAFLRRAHGPDDADDLAERLTLRDREGDDRRMCIECSHLGERGRCMAAAAARLPGADRRLEPVPTILQRCEAFGLKKRIA